MSKRYEKAGAFAGKALHYAFDDPYSALAVSIVYSGVINKDREFLASDWCAHLLEYIGVNIPGPKLLEKYLGGAEHGKR